jgi:ubiquitin-protein ligase
MTVSDKVEYNSFFSTNSYFDSNLHYVYIYVSEIYTGNLTKRLLSELQQTERLELQGTFILDVYPIAVFSNVKPPPRFNNTIPTPNLYSRGLPIIHGRILPQSKLYCRASFLIEITLPFEYPLKAFSLIFLDPIYHPSVDKFGRNRRSWGFRNSDMWTPRTSIAEVIEAVIGIIDGDLDVEYPDNDECAEEYRVAPQTFYEKAIRMTTSYGRPRY